MPDQQKHRIRYRLGLVLLGLNYPFGYGSLWLGGILFIKTKSAVWLTVGGGLYLISWMMLVAGFMMAGKRGVRHLHFFLRRTKRRIRFLHLRDKNEKNTGSPGNGV